MRSAVIVGAIAVTTEYWEESQADGARETGCPVQDGGKARFDAAHYHPTFVGLTPCERVFDDAIGADPLAWISRRLADLPSMLSEAGHADLVAELDGDAVSQAMQAILATIEATLAYRPGVTNRSD